MIRPPEHNGFKLIRVGRRRWFISERSGCVSIYRCLVSRDRSRASTATLAIVAVARVGVGVAMVAVPTLFNRQGTGTEALLMRTVGVRDVVLGSGGCAAWANGDKGEIRRWAAMGLLSDSADLVTGLGSKSLVGRKSAMIATLAPVPFLAAEIFGFARGIRKPAHQQQR